MARSLKWLQSALLVSILVNLVNLVNAQTSTPAAGASATTSYRPLFTVPTEATVGANLLPNIEDPQV